MLKIIKEKRFDKCKYKSRLCIVHTLSVFKWLFLALIIACNSCHPATELKQPTGIDSIAAPKPIESYNGLGIALLVSPLKYHVGDEYTLRIVFTNLSHEEKTIWIPLNKIEIEITDDNYGGKTVSYLVPNLVSSHNMSLSEAWQNDLFRLKPNESRVFKRMLGRNVIGNERILVRYSNNNKEIKMLRYMGRDKNYKPEVPFVSDQQLVSLWTGTLVSKPVVIEFVQN